MKAEKKIDRAEKNLCGLKMKRIRKRFAQSFDRLLFSSSPTKKNMMMSGKKRG
jgi:hypothetical protein